MIQDFKEHIPVVHIAKKYRYSRTTVYRWINRYLDEGKEGLLNRSNRPKNPHPNSLSAKKVKAIVRLRKRTKYGPKRLKFELFQRGIKVSEYAIYRTLVREQLISKHKKHKKKPKKYYAPYPGYRVQIDTKYLDTKPGFPYRFYQYTATDAYTRMRVIRVFDERTAEYAVKFLKEVVRSLPFRVLAVCTDNGVEFTYGPFKKDHPFSLECARQNIRHILNRPAYPQANGRCERSHRTDEEEFYRVVKVKVPHEWVVKIRRWEHRYNYQRPHMALGMKTPYQAWLNYQNSEKQKEKERTKEKEKDISQECSYSVT